jgi:hypothetical protein
MVSINHIAEENMLLVIPHLGPCHDEVPFIQTLARDKKFESVEVVIV